MSLSRSLLLKVPTHRSLFPLMQGGLVQTNVLGNLMNCLIMVSLLLPSILTELVRLLRNLSPCSSEVPPHCVEIPHSLPRPNFLTMLLPRMLDSPASPRKKNVNFSLSLSVGLVTTCPRSRYLLTAGLVWLNCLRNEVELPIVSP